MIMNLKNNYYQFIERMSNIKALPLLIIRLVLAYGFYEPAKMKLKDISSIASWFDSMGYPLPTLNAYLAAFTEGLGVILLVLGLGTRLISIPLMFVMIVAITTVHWSNGFAAGDNGFEIPLYYLIMLFVLIVYGGGKWSLDAIVNNKLNK